HELRIQHIQTVSFGRQRCRGLLQTEFVAAVTSVRRELDEVTWSPSSCRASVLGRLRATRIVTRTPVSRPQWDLAGRGLWGELGKRGGARLNTSWICLEMRRRAISRPSAILL